MTNHIQNYDNATAFGIDIGAMAYIVKYLQVRLNIYHGHLVLKVFLF